MNRIYKVIWNEALGCFTAVGEYAKGRGKSSKSSVGSNTNIHTTSNLFSINTLRLSAIGLGLLAAGFTISPQVFSQVNVGGGTGDGTAISSCKTNSTEANAEGSYSVAIGCDADAGKNFNLVDRGNPSFAWTGGSQNDSGSTAIGTGTQAGDVATALGTQAKALGQSSVAIGAAAFSNGNTSLALGRQSAATANFAQAIGNVSSATGEGALAVGHSALASGRRGIAIGSTDFENAVTVADQPNVGYRADGQTQAIGSDTIAFGSNAKATADNSLAFGAGSKSQVKSGVALGSTSIANRAGGFTGFVPVGTLSIDENAIIKTKSVALGAVSIGTGEVGGNRQIVNLAAGTSDSDAVNVAQLKGLQNGVNYTLNQGIDFGGDSGTKVNRKLGEKLLVKGGETDGAKLANGNNIGVVADGTNTLTVKLAKDLTGLTSVTTGNSLLNTNGLSITGGPKFTATGINANNQQITNVASGGTTESNAANIGDLNTAITGVSTLGFGLKAADGNTVQKPLGQAVEVVGANNNIDTRVNNGKIEVELNDNLDLGSTGSIKIGSSSPIGLGLVTTVDRLGLTTGNGLGSTAINGAGVFVNGPLGIPSTLLTTDGLTILNGPSMTRSGGIDAADKKITNVKAGVAVDDAVNVSQLNSSSAAAKTEVGAGTNITDVVKTTGSNGQDIYTVNADGVTASAGSTAVIVTAGTKDTATNMTDYAVDLSDASKASLVKADSAMQNVITQIDGNDVKTLDKDNNTANFLTGDNIVLTAENGGIKVATKDKVVFTEVTTGNTLLNTDGVSFLGVSTVRLSSMGLDNGGNPIRNVGKGTLNTDAVNVEQLKEVAIALDQGWGITAQGDIATMVKQGSTVDMNSRDGNIKVSRTSASNTATGLSAAAIPAGANDISFDLNPDVNLNSVTTGDTTINDNGLTIAGGPSVTKNGIDAANNKITNVQNGEVTATSQEAINGSQLYAQGSGISSIIGGNTVYDPTNGTFTNSNIGGTGQGSIDGAIASIREGTIEINENVQTNTTNIATNTTNIATNTTNIATNTTNIATNVTNIKANKDRLDAGLNFGADSGTNINKPVGDSSVLKFTGGNNITTTAQGSAIKFDLNGSINLDSVTTGNTTVNNNGVTIVNGPSMTANGIDAASNKITNVADGMAPRDAVNFGQLDAVSRRLGDSMNELGYKIGEVEDDANAGISAAMAMSSLPQAYIIGKSMIGGGIGTYNGESAVAIGFSKLSNDGRWVMKLNGTADTQGNAGASIGAGFHFD